MNSIDTFFNRLQVFDVELPKIRIGRQGDGGYVVLEDLCQKTKAIYSYGVGNDVSFEVDFLNRFGGVARCFDPTIKTFPSDDSRLTFMPTGLGTKDYDTLCSDLATFHDPEDRLLKIDIEGNEWDVLPSLHNRHYLIDFTQIIIELHIIPCVSRTPDVPYTGGILGPVSPYFAQFFQQFDVRTNIMLFTCYSVVLSYLLENFVIFHVHANNSLPNAIIGNYLWPQLLELSLVRRNMVKRLTPTNQVFPVPGLDLDNKTNRMSLGPTLPFS